MGGLPLMQCVEMVVRSIAFSLGSWQQCRAMRLTWSWTQTGFFFAGEISALHSI